MLASGQPTFSNGGKTLTIPVRSGVKWNDGKPFTASDVAFTFNLIKAHPALFTPGSPIVTSASAPSATSVTAELRHTAVRQPVPDRAGLHRAPAHLVHGGQSGHVR